MNKWFYKLSKINFFWITAIFILFIFCFGTAYYYLSKTENGIHFAFAEGKEASITYSESLYFSVVAFTTFGFGDFYPVGYSRYLVMLQVILGLVFFGLLVSKFTAAKGDFILHRLYTGDVQRRLLEFDNGIRELTNEIEQMNTLVAENPELIQKRVTSNKNENYYEDLLSLMMGLRKYIGFEVYYGEIFLDISKRSIYRVLDSTIRLLETLNTIHSDKSRDIIINRSNFKRLEKIVKTSYHIAKIINDYSKENKSKVKCKEIQRLSQKYTTRVLKLELFSDQ